MVVVVVVVGDVWAWAGKPTTVMAGITQLVFKRVRLSSLGRSAFVILFLFSALLISVTVPTSL